MKEWCLICDACEVTGDEPGVRVCNCKGFLRFLAWGACPTTGKQADKLFSVLRERFGLSKRRGRKPQITFIDVAEMIKRMPASASLSEVAGALGKALRKTVTEGAVKRAIKPLALIDPSCGTFSGLQAVLKGKEMPRRSHSSRYRKQLRNR